MENEKIEKLILICATQEHSLGSLTRICTQLCKTQDKLIDTLKKQLKLIDICEERIHKLKLLVNQ